MTINELILILSNQITALNNARTSAAAIGDVEQVAIIDAKILETQATLDTLKGLV